METITMAEACKLADENPLGMAALWSDDNDSAALWSALRAGDAYMFDSGDVRFSVVIAGTKHTWIVKE